MIKRYCEITVYVIKNFYKQENFSSIIISCFPVFVKKIKERRRLFAAAKIALLFPERLAVRALIHGGVCFVGAHKDFVQRAVVCVVAVVCALANGAFDALVGIFVHDLPSFCFARD